MPAHLRTATAIQIFLLSSVRCLENMPFLTLRTRLLPFKQQNVDCLAEILHIIRQLGNVSVCIMQGGEAEGSGGKDKWSWREVCREYGVWNNKQTKGPGEAVMG